MELTTTDLGVRLIVLLLYLSTIIGVIATVLSENRNPLKASAWVVIVGFIPILGLLSYIVFGQDQRRLHRINRRFYRSLMRHPLQLSMPHAVSQSSEAVAHWGQLVRMIEQSASSPLLAVSAIETFTSGGAMYERLFADLARAKHHIHLQAYIFDQDKLFDRLTALLIDRRAEGVDVRIIYDYLGSYAVERRRWEALQSLGVQTYAFLPVHIPLLSSTVNYRNHRKVCVIDSEIGYVGGMNFADRYLEGDHLGPWRDTHFRLEGDAVAALQSSFLLDWYSVSRRVVNMDKLFALRRPSPSPTQSAIQLIMGGPIDTYPRIEQAFIGMVSRARERILIQTPYFLPTEALHKALTMAALSGVHVEVMIPAHGDSRFTSYAVASYIESLLEVGITVLRYQRGFLHSKLMVVDGCIAAIGSANMDFRSLEHNFEIAGIVYDECLAQELERIHAHDREQCLQLSLVEWRRRGYTQRAMESVMRLFAPLL